MERLLKMKAQAASAQPPTEGSRPRPDASPCPSPGQDPPTEPGFGIATHLLQLGGPPNAGTTPPPPAVPLCDAYRELYAFFGDSLATRFGTGVGPRPPQPPAPGPRTPEARKEVPAPPGTGDAGRKMPQLTANATVSPRDEEPPRAERPAPPRPAAAPRARGTPRQPGHRPGVRDVFQKSRLAPRGAPRFSFVIAGRQAGRRCPGRLFQTCFPQHHGPGHVSRYAQKLPMIGRTARPLRKWRLSEYSLYLPL